MKIRCDDSTMSMWFGWTGVQHPQCDYSLSFWSLCRPSMRSQLRRFISILLVRIIDSHQCYTSFTFHSSQLQEWYLWLIEDSVLVLSSPLCYVPIFGKFCCPHPILKRYAVGSSFHYILEFYSCWLYFLFAGPFLRVVEGDTLEVVFRNTLEEETTLTPLGVIHTVNDTEGVPTNETVTYNWNITSDVSFLK